MDIGPGKKEMILKVFKLNNQLHHQHINDTNDKNFSVLFNTIRFFGSFFIKFWSINVNLLNFCKQKAKKYNSLINSLKNFSEKICQEVGKDITSNIYNSIQWNSNIFK